MTWIHLVINGGTDFCVGACISDRERPSLVKIWFWWISTRSSVTVVILSYKCLRERPCIYVGMCSLPKKIFLNFFIFLKSRYQGMKLLCIYLGSTAKTVAVRAVSKFIEVNLGKTEDWIFQRWINAEIWNFVCCHHYRQGLEEYKNFLKIWKFLL